MEFSKFSRHFDPGSGILRLMDDLGSAEHSEQPVRMLGGGNPAIIPEMEREFRTAMEDVMADGRSFEQMLGNYDAPQGNLPFRKALASLLHARFGWLVGPENIAITNGSQSAFGFLFNLFSGEFADGSHKHILLPMTPEYIGYSDVGLADKPIFKSAKPRIERMDDLLFKYRVDFDNIQCGEDIGAICVSRPTNPTGNVITDNELNRLRALANEKKIPLIIDGAYGLPFPGIIFNEATPVWDENIVLCLSLSKLGLPGIRAGILIAAPALIRLMTGANAIFTLSPGRYGPTLVSEMTRSGRLLTLSDQVVKPYYQKRSDEAIERIREVMADLPVRVHVSEGAIFLWLWFENLPISSEELYQRLKVRGVLVIAGEHFFPGLTEPEWQHTKECIRVSYAASEDAVREGLKIIAEEVRNAYQDQSNSQRERSNNLERLAI
ncbi:MAG: valine--pyruvate transaminase [Acidiferrobacterales bacterium]|nr:valine--pyruvate transaminase [Acidiferrobacterales bacterium]